MLVWHMCYQKLTLRTDDSPLSFESTLALSRGLKPYDFKLHGHKNVLSLVPYYKTLFYKSENFLKPN